MTFASRSLLPVALALSVAPAAAADLRVAAPPAVVDRCARVEPAPGTPSVPGGDIFGFTSPTDIGDPCSWAFASEHSGGVGKRDGSWLAVSFYRVPLTRCQLESIGCDDSHTGRSGISE